MDLRLRLAFVCCLFGPVVFASTSAKATVDKQEKPQVFRAGIEVVSLNVTVSDAQGRYLTDLGQDEFSVFEDGAKQELTYFNRTNLPIALSLLIDSSASMEQRMENAQEAAIGFAKKLRPQDLAQVVDFDSRVEIKLGFTNQVEELAAAIHATSAGGSTALHNAVYIALKELAKIKAKNPDEIRRQAIVILSDGEDTSSRTSFDETLGYARESGAVVYAVGIGGGARGKLKRLAEDTGGRYFQVGGAAELGAVYEQIERELRSQYFLTFAPVDADIDLSQVEVRVRDRRLNVRATRGYAP
jgi:Ca-activated chloride channel family protein